MKGETVSCVCLHTGFSTLYKQNLYNISWGKPDFQQIDTASL